jgi:hypothetical protein
MTFALALGLPDLDKPPTLYVAKRQGALEVLTQKLCGKPQPVAYFLNNSTLFPVDGPVDYEQ